MQTTQDNLPIKDIRSDLVLLKNGSVAMVFETTAVNFDLLSEREQLGIIDAFAAMLNSLSFPIEIVIRSKRLNISSYLDLLSKAEQQQQNPLLKSMMQHYRQFVSALIRDNEVLDKSFFLVLPVSFLELGIIADSAKHIEKAITLLIPRKDHVLKLMARMGLRAIQLNNERLVALFYDYYNESFIEDIDFINPDPVTPPNPTLAQPKPQTPITAPNLATNNASMQPPPVPNTPAFTPREAVQAAQTQNEPRFVSAMPTPQQPVSNIPVPNMPPTPQPTFTPQTVNQVAPPTYANRPIERRVPFVVEELPDN